MAGAPDPLLVLGETGNQILKEEGTEREGAKGDLETTEMAAHGRGLCV